MGITLISRNKQLKDTGSLLDKPCSEQSVMSHNNIDMLELYTVPHLPGAVIVQHDGTPPHYTNIVHEYLDKTLSSNG
ncbi:hypothetical protein NPIL_55011 [Nephila pilipes]|uniref:Uncharacterized protein n=1 Tax=Nephila pilipes TaxID=299642 RepID=A0A8X6UBE1_NEPPI|nr:hypothetical protein NPIL_55011 [Nephila pilipes]